MTNEELLAEYETTRAQYVLARTAILGGAQAYSISGANGSRSLTRGDLKFIQEQIDKLTTDIRTLERGNRIQIQTVVPRT